MPGCLDGFGEFFDVALQDFGDLAVGAGAGAGGAYDDFVPERHGYGAGARKGAFRAE